MSSRGGNVSAVVGATRQAERSEATRRALVGTARELFAARGYAAVGTEEVVRGAGVTRGALYHHFESKLGLYLFVRRDIERRLLDRMEGAAGAAPGGLKPSRSRCWLALTSQCAPTFSGCSVNPPGAEDDPLVDFLAAQATPPSRPVGLIVGAAWRVALLAVADGAPPDQTRNALRTLEFRGEDSSPETAE